MKKLILWAALVLPFFLQAQQDIPADVLAKMPTYVQFNHLQYMKGLRVTNSVTVGAQVGNFYDIVGADGKPFLFDSDSHVCNYMAAHGYVFLDYSPISDAERAVAGVSVIRRMLFKKKE